MLESLITFLIVVLVLFVIWFALAKFLPGTASQIIGIICGLILLIYALRIFHLLPVTFLFSATSVVAACWFR